MLIKENPISISARLSKTSLGAGEEGAIIVSIKNTSEAPLTNIEAEILTPEGIVNRSEKFFLETLRAGESYSDKEFEFIPTYYQDIGSYQRPTSWSHRVTIVKNRALQLQAYYGVIKDVDLYATGYDWVQYPQEEKIALMAVMFDFYNLDKEVYSIEKGIKLLDVSYYQAEKLAKERPDLDKDAYFSVYCLFNFGTILNDKETDWGIKSLIKDK